MKSQKREWGEEVDVIGKRALWHMCVCGNNKSNTHKGRETHELAMCSPSFSLQGKKGGQISISEMYLQDARERGFRHRRERRSH